MKLKTFFFSFFSLAIVWLLLSGYFKAILLILGAISCLFVTYLSVRLKIYSSTNDRLKFNLRLPLYAPWLLVEIIKSNIHVAKLVLSPRSLLQPQTLTTQPSQKTNTGIAVHANSITLTPGTISVDINDSGILVHALSDHTAQGIIDKEIDTQVTKHEERIT